MAIRALAILVALPSFVAVMACDRMSPGSPTLTSSNLSSTVFSPASEVGSTVQEVSGQAFVLLGGTLTQLNSIAATPNSPAALNDFTSVRTIDWSMACRQGGTKSVSGTVSVSRSTGSGVVNTDLQLTFTNCDTGRVILQGNPGITLIGQTTFQVGMPDTHTFTKAGGLTFTVPSGEQGSVQFNCTVTWSRQTGVVSSTGNVSWEFPIGTPITGPGCRGD